MSYLYVTDNSAQISIKENYVTVKYKDGMIRNVPIETLESISIFGKCQITTACIQVCLYRGIGISYYSKGGSYFGRLHSTGNVNVKRQRLQANLLGSELALELAKKIIRSKVHNQIVVMQRYAKSRNFDSSLIFQQMKILMNKIQNCKDINQIMGYEGIVARLYFQTLGKLVDENFTFQRRSRRPPKDAFNSMLSLGYSILMNEIYGKVESKGLNPYFGFIHQDRENHPTLASDLMEEWRAVIVDSLVMSLINGHEILESHFYSDSEQGGIFLKKEGMNIFIKKIEGKMRNTQHYLTDIEYKVSFRRAIELQVNALAKAIEKNNPDVYQPLWIR